MPQSHTPLHPVLRSIVVEATEALKYLDADRLEELALSCQKLNREFPPHSESFRVAASSSLLTQTIPLPQSGLAPRSANHISPEMAVFSRLLSLTRENLAVLNRVRSQQSKQLEYSQREAGIAWQEPEVKDGHNR